MSFCHCHCVCVFIFLFLKSFSFVHANVFVSHHQVNGKRERRSNDLVGKNVCGQKEWLIDGVWGRGREWAKLFRCGGDSRASPPHHVPCLVPLTAGFLSVSPTATRVAVWAGATSSSRGSPDARDGSLAPVNLDRGSVSTPAPCIWTPQPHGGLPVWANTCLGSGARWTQFLKLWVEHTRSSYPKSPGWSQRFWRLEDRLRQLLSQLPKWMRRQSHPLRLFMMSLPRLLQPNPLLTQPCPVLQFLHLLLPPLMQVPVCPLILSILLRRQSVPQLWLHGTQRTKSWGVLSHLSKQVLPGNRQN